VVLGGGVRGWWKADWLGSQRLGLVECSCSGLPYQHCVCSAVTFACAGQHGGTGQCMQMVLCGCMQWFLAMRGVVRAVV
jgi:hypothetical protein